VSLAPTLRFENCTDAEQLFVLERMTTLGRWLTWRHAWNACRE
jgi:hypothetical protein